MTRQIHRATALVAVLSLFSHSISFADPGNHPVSMWQVEGKQNRVYLLGSIHLLREKDYPISPAIYDAYREAEALYMELDMDDANPVADQMLANELGLIQGDKLLRDILGDAVYADAEALAETAKIPLQLLEKTEPWYAAIQVELIMLLRIGFNPIYGIESHLAERAAADSKEIFGLETVRQQLGFLDNLSAPAQQEMLMQTLADSLEFSGTMETLVDAWHTGDSSFLIESLLTDMQKYPELNKIIVVDRNLAWSDKIEELLIQEDDYLIVVGALHLVGENGVPGLLKQRGYDVMQLNQTAN